MFVSGRQRFLSGDKKTCFPGVAMRSISSIDSPGFL